MIIHKQLQVKKAKWAACLRSGYVKANSRQHCPASWKPRAHEHQFLQRNLDNLVLYLSEKRQTWQPMCEPSKPPPGLWIKPRISPPLWQLSPRPWARSLVWWRGSRTAPAAKHTHKIQTQIQQVPPNKHPPLSTAPQCLLWLFVPLHNCLHTPGKSWQHWSSSQKCHLLICHNFFSFFSVAN